MALRVALSAITKSEMRKMAFAFYKLMDIYTIEFGQSIIHLKVLQFRISKMPFILVCTDSFQLSKQYRLRCDAAGVSLTYFEHLAQSVFSPGKEWAGPFFPRGKNRPAHSFPTQSISPPPLIISKIIMELLFLRINLKSRY